MATIKEVISESTNRVYRRLSIKRLKIDSIYETNWLDVSAFVAKGGWGKTKKSFGDNEFLGNIQIDGTTIRLDNNRGEFNDETSQRSIFNGFKTRYRTKFKIEIGFLDPITDQEIPGDIFYGILFGEPSTNDKGTVTFKIAPMIKVFQNYPAEGIALTAGTTADLVERLAKKDQGGVRIFDQYCEGTTDAQRYQINTNGDPVTAILAPEIEQKKSVFNKMSDYSTMDQFFFQFNNQGNFEWKSKSQSVGVQWIFNGAGAKTNDYGTNISEIKKVVQGINNTFGRVTIEYAGGLETTSSATWTQGDGSPQDLYGERTFSAKFPELQQSEAEAIALKIRQEYQTPKKEITLETPLIPHLELKDIVQVYYSGEEIVSAPIVIGTYIIGDPNYYIGGQAGSINIIGEFFKIIGISINRDNLSCEFKLREF